ncbi:MAG: hypothetical protein ACFE7R_08835 [Candidatus Hodarchaeota archaeon]
MYKETPLDSISIPLKPLIRLQPEKLNAVLGQLLVPTQISLIHGPERAPLTALAHEIVVAGTRKGTSKSVFLDSGSNYSPSLVRSICANDDELRNVPSCITVGEVLGLSDVEELANQISTLGTVSIVVLDSLTSVLNLSSNPGEVGRQRKLFHTLELLRFLVNSHNLHVVLTDHSNRAWRAAKSSPVGGNVIRHAVDTIVRVDKLDTGQNLIRILVEQSPLSIESNAIILRTSKRGFKSIN